MLVDSDKLMGRAEIRARLNVGHTRFRQLVNRPDFPKPIKKLAGTHIWDGDAIEAWIAQHRPPPPDEPEA